MQYDLYQSRRQKFSELHMIMLADKKYVSVHEPTMQLLGLLASLETRAIDEIESGIDRPELWLRLKGDVLNGDEVDL